MDYNQYIVIFFTAIIAIMLFSLLTYVFFGIWIYKDCKERGENPLIWILLLFFTSIFVGLIIYLLLRKQDKKNCHNCGSFISNTAKYCENCGVVVENTQQLQNQAKKTNGKYIIAGFISFIIILVCTVVVIVTAVLGIGIESDVTINKHIYNTGFKTFSRENKVGNNWSLSLKSATNGFVEEVKMEINNPQEEILYADTYCETIPEGANLMLWLVQDDIVKSVDVTNLSQTLEYSLSEFKEGKIYVRLQINGVKDIKSKIYIK